MGRGVAVGVVLVTVFLGVWLRAAAPAATAPASPPTTLASDASPTVPETILSPVSVLHRRKPGPGVVIAVVVGVPGALAVAFAVRRRAE